MNKQAQALAVLLALSCRETGRAGRRCGDVEVGAGMFSRDVPSTLASCAPTVFAVFDGCHRNS
jgi:hypothetical protein